jgi:serine/threonine-protein kinase
MHAHTRWSVGTTLGGRWELVERVGGPDHRPTFRATDHAGGPAVALKVAPRNAVAEMQREADAVDALARHGAASPRPGAVGVDEGADAAFLPLVWVEGDALSRLRPPPPWPHRVALARWRAAVTALVPLHAAGWVHADIKPSNAIWQGATGTVVWIDHGLARPGGVAFGEPGQLFGSVHTMAPEQLRAAVLTPAADVYALGVTAHWMWAGRWPFHAHSRDATLLARLTQSPPPLPATAPAAIQALIDRGLARDPNDRPADATALAAAIADAAPVGRWARFTARWFPGAR